MLTTLLPIVLLQALSASAAPLLSSRDASASLIDCLSTANLNPISASSSSYSQDISAYNQRIQPKPAAVVYPSTPSLVSASITCASSAGVSVSARSGGHSYASYGQGGTDGALVIDLGAFKHISVDQGTGVATIGGGVRLGDIALGLNELGRGLPHGTCPYVGVGGHASFGGFGLAGRRNGLLVDTVVALDVVLANGTIISKLTNEIDPDLFWALRGSAQSYGIITTFYFQSFEAPAKATNFAYSYYGMSAGDAAGLFSLWQKFGAESAPADLGTSFTIGTGGSIDISGVYYGTADEFHDVFDPFVDTIPTGYQQKVDELSWIDSLAALAGGQALNTSGAADSRDDFLAKSLMTPEASLITDEALESYFKYLFTTTTSTAWFVEVNLYGGKNSVINSHDLAFNSFGHRSSLLTFQMYASSPSYSPPYPDEGFSFLEGFERTKSRCATSGTRGVLSSSSTQRSSSPPTGFLRNWHILRGVRGARLTAKVHAFTARAQGERCAGRHLNSAPVRSPSSTFFPLCPFRLSSISISFPLSDSMSGHTSDSESSDSVYEPPASSLSRSTRVGDRTQLSPPPSHGFAPPPRFSAQCSGDEDDDYTPVQEEPLDSDSSSISRKADLRRKKDKPKLKVGHRSDSRQLARADSDSFFLFTDRGGASMRVANLAGDDDRSSNCSNCRLHHQRCFWHEAEPQAIAEEDELVAAREEIQRLRLLVQMLTKQSSEKSGDVAYPARSHSTTPLQDKPVSQPSFTISNTISSLVENSNTHQPPPTHSHPPQFFGQWYSPQPQPPPQPSATQHNAQMPAYGQAASWEQQQQQQFPQPHSGPYTKSVVAAMQLRIDTLEKELEAITSARSGAATGTHTPSGTHHSAPIPHNLHISREPSLLPKHTPLDAFQGGLALNAHGELRFYGPTSSYRSVLADESSGGSTPFSPANFDAIRAFSLTRAPVPYSMPAEPALPQRPPDLSPDFKARLLRMAFEYCFAHYNCVPEREFYADLQAHPDERSSWCSPFLLNVMLAVGCRYLDPAEDYPVEICGLQGDPDTRGDVFMTWARYLLDQEWYNPNLATIRGLNILGMYLAGRGFDGPCFMFTGLAMRLCEDFGLHLGIHRLSIGVGGISEELITSRRDAFFSTLSHDVYVTYLVLRTVDSNSERRPARIASMYIGRRVYLSPDEIDQIPPPVVPELDFDEPMYRSSSFHWSSKLILLGARIMTTVYALKPGVTLRARQSAVPELHLALESWYHDLPSHLRASMSDASKSPHPHIISLNLAYHCFHIQLHRPFFRRLAKDAATNVSTHKCLAAANHIVRLVKLHKHSHGLRLSAACFQHAAFCCGTILALSASEDGISETPSQDAARRALAKADLRLVIDALREAGRTWTTAITSADILEALLHQWEPAKFSSHPENTTSDLAPLGGNECVTASFPYMFPSFDLDPAGELDFMSLLMYPLPESIVNSPENEAGIVTM
ncbi:hypothetical protein P7C70_g5706, partial [Phenoliferia sp. Uapishka_3]